MFTMLEHANRPSEQISFAYVGDARNNVANSLLVAGSMMGMDVRIVGPEQLHPTETVTTAGQAIAVETGARITVTDDLEQGVEGVDFVYTDVWVSMGEPADTWDERIALLSPYQVNEQLMKLTGNRDAKFMHCLPALHSPDTDLGEQMFQHTGCGRSR
jgi:ornithine carbamoyltransferase